MKATDIRGCWFTLNRDCNLRCKWCYSQSSYFRATDQMPFDVSKKLIDICLALGVKNFILIGGEPTLHEHICDIVAHIALGGGSIAIMTNGIAFCDIEFCRKIYQAGGERVQVNTSLKGLSDEEYLDNAGVASFHDVEQGLKNCEEVGLKYSFVYIVSAQNVDGLSDFSEKYAKFGYTKYPLSLAHCSDFLEEGEFVPPKGSVVMSPVDMDRKFNRQYETLNNNLGNSFALHQTLPICMCDPSVFATMKERNQVFTTCHLSRKKGCVFDTNGGILMCNHLLGYGIGQFGVDYDDLKSFTIFFQSDKVKNFRNRLTTMPSVSCLKCKNATLCGGGCCIRWFTESYDDLRKQALQT